MKIIFTILLFLSSSFCFCQNTFRTGTLASNYNQLFDLVQLSDGSFVGLGYSEENSEEEEFIGYTYLVKINSEGQLLASYRLTSDVGNDIYADGGNKLIKTNDGNLALCGSINDAIALYKFDPNLNLLFRKQYATPEEFSYGISLLQTPEGNYVLAGSHERGNSDNSNYNGAGILIKTNSAGTVIWCKQYTDITDAEYSYNDFMDIVLTKDGNYAMLATAEAVNTSEYDTTYLIKTDTSGKILWSKYMTTANFNQAPASLLSTSDGGFLITGSVDTTYETDELDNRYRYADAMIVKCDASGNILWSKKGNNSLGKQANFFKALEDKDGGYLLSGIKDSSDGYLTDEYFSSEGYICKVNSSGALQWTKVFDNADRSEELSGIIHTNDGGYAACGSLYYPYDSDYYDSSYGLVYKFNANFVTCRNTSAYGSFSDLGASFTAKTLPYYTIAASGFTDAIITSATQEGAVLCSNIYPLQLLSFSATLQNKGVNVEWKTANEINTGYFIVEKSSNATSFIALQKITAKSNSNVVQTYTISDLQPLPGTSYYRLKQVDKDGSFTYSNTVPVTVSADGTIVISPNPVQNNIRILLQSPAASRTVFYIADITGNTLATQVTNVTAGANTILIPAASLSKGLYVLKVIQNNSAQSIRFIKE